MKKLHLKIGNNSYYLKFGFGCFRFLAEKWELEGFPEVLERVLQVSQSIDKMKFSDMQIIIDVIYAAVYANGEITEIQIFNNDDCGDMLLNDPATIAKVFEALVESMPKPKIEVETEAENENLGKPKPVRKTKNSPGTITK